MVNFDKQDYKLLNSWRLAIKDDFAPMLTDITTLLTSYVSNRTKMIALLGDLGAGKTTLTRKLLACWEYLQVVPSPTYTLIEEHSTKLFPVIHMDLYRLDQPADIYGLGFEDYIAPSDNLLIIEWPKFDLINAYQMQWVCQITMHADDSRTYDWYERSV